MVISAAVALQQEGSWSSSVIFHTLRPFSEKCIVLSSVIADTLLQFDSTSLEN